MGLPSGRRQDLGEVRFQHGWDCFDEHDSGILLAQEGVDALLSKAAALESLPASWTLRLEGRCAAAAALRPADGADCGLWESVAEEAADVCRDRLLQAGVRHRIVCTSSAPTSAVAASQDSGADTGSGNATASDGAGICVLVSLVEEPVAPAPESQPVADEPAGDIGARRTSAASDWDKDASDSAKAKADAEAAAPSALSPPLPSGLEGLNDAQQLVLLEERLLELAGRKGLAFEANSAEMSEGSHETAKRIAEILKAFPKLGVQCAGHSKGRPGDNTLAKRALSQDRAANLRRALAEAGAPNTIACVGFGSALGRGNCVRLHGMLPGEAEHEDASLRILGWNTSGLSCDQERSSLDQLLKEALEGLSFEPNSAEIKPAAMMSVRRAAWVLKAFPMWRVCCEGHSKGQPDDNNNAKIRLSQVRAEALAAALQAHGASSKIKCVGLGCSQGIGMVVRMVAEELERDLEVPELAEKSEEERAKVLRGLLAAVSERGIFFEPNSYDIPASELGAIRSIARVLKAFPSALVCIEGHAKGLPEENNEAKRKLSQARAEAVRVAVRLEGALNSMICVGEGSARGQGAGLKVRMADREEFVANQIAIPDTTGLNLEEQEDLANKLLAKALEGGIEFEPNSSDIPISGMATVRSVAKVLQEFPSFDIKCEGHTKGLPAENSAARLKLSRLRAEALSSAVASEGAINTIDCVGRGSALGIGMCVRMFVFNPERAAAMMARRPSRVPPGAESLIREERRELMNKLLAEVLAERRITFEPNSVEIEAGDLDLVQELAGILRAFKEFKVTCEGHTKGLPDTNNVAKIRLSQARAESVRTAIRNEGAPSEMEIACEGRGCAEGIGICVRLFAAPDGSSEGAGGAGA